MKNEIGGFLVGCVSLLLISCGDCEGNAKDADAFVEDPANQVCTTDADCVVVHQNCAPMKTTHCGQVSMSAKAAQSKKWADIMGGMEACEEQCDVCHAMLIPRCGDGVCRSPSE